MTRNRVQDQVDDGADVELVTIQDPRSSFFVLSPFRKGGVCKFVHFLRIFVSLDTIL